MPQSHPTSRLLAALCAAAAGSAAVLTGGAASAAGEVEVAGTSFPGSRANFAYVGCSDVTAAGGSAPSAKVREIAGTRYGTRSTGFTATGAGAGPKSSVGSVGDLSTFSVDAWSEAGAAGFAYVWLFPDDRNTAWLGTVPVSSASDFATQDVSGAEFSWSRRDRGSFAADGRTVSGLDLDDAVRRFGDGPGHVGFAYGCDGSDFSLDGFSVGTPSSATTYDFEGIDVTTSIVASRSEAGPRTTLVGRSSGAGQNTGEPLTLQRRRQGEQVFSPVTGIPVTVGATGVHRAQVRPAKATEFRWSRAEVPYADGGTSAAYEVPGRLKSGKVDQPAPTPTRKPDGGVRGGGVPDRPDGPDPAPAEPQPTEPQPTEPQPTEPNERPTPEPTDPQPTEPSPSAPQPTAPEPEPKPEPEPEPTAPDPTATDPDAALVAACEAVLDEDVTTVLTPDELAAVTLGEDATLGTEDDCVWESTDDWLTEQGLRESVG